MDSFNKIREILDQTEADVAKHESGNASAGTRVRNAMQEIKKLAQVVRTEVQEAKTKSKA